jgi:23S rRNA pseudouridine955/2504/2580 synthase
MTIELKAGINDNGRRLDRILRKTLPDHPLSLIHRLLRQGKVLVDGKPVSGPEKRVIQGEIITLESFVNLDKNVVNKKTAAFNHALPEILWQGTGIIVFNKPPGLTTHGKASLDTLVKAHLGAKLPPSLSFRPGPLHRLDRQSSGAIAFSQTLEGAQLFTRLLREKKLVKTYLAIVEGRLCQDETWQDDLARDRIIKKTLVNTGKLPHEKSQKALTTVRVLARNDAHTLIEAQITTGRTHQIRSQAAAHGHPLAGDTKYGGHVFSGSFYLHAWKIETPEKEARSTGLPQLITAPLPPSFLSQISTIFGKDITYSSFLTPNSSFAANS